MEPFLPAFIMAFREGLEALLIITILLRFLTKSKHLQLKKYVWQGMFFGILGSCALGIILVGISAWMGGTESIAKLWESIASFIAVLLITTFIIWMIKHGNKMREHVESQAKLHLSKAGIFLLALFLVLREGAEIAIFTFAGKYTFLPVLTGILLAILFVICIHYAIIRIKLKTLFSITLLYLILQAGFLLGYSIHEGLSATKNVNLISPDHPIFTKAYDVSATPFDNKKGVIGLPLHIALGWYAKPEWIQFIIQYMYTFSLLWMWKKYQVNV